jgi:hypothetical protein
VAEGSEHAEPAAQLASLGCQDYLFSRPLSTTAMTELLARCVADGGFHLPTTAQPAGSLSEVG